jgi:hypothetical protein
VSPVKKSIEEEPAPSDSDVRIKGLPTNSDKNFPQNESFLPTGKSLDLYVIMDKSSSLWRDVDEKENKIAGTDPTCKRLDALLDLIDEMRKKLVAKEQVRLTIITFGTNPAHFNMADFNPMRLDPSARESVLKTLKPMDDLLSHPRSAIDAEFRAGVCNDSKDPQFTHYASGIKEALNSKFGLTALKKYDVETALFFSDGAANDPTEEELKDAIDKLNNAFPGRLWGVMLGEGTGKCTLTKAGGAKLSAKECMVMLVGADLSKFLLVKSAAGLSAALTGLIEKK